MTSRIEAFGLSLIRLGAMHLELVRSWRNHPDIQRYMAYREEIGAEDQIRWFSSLDPATQFYFVVYEHEKPLGLVNIKNVRNGEGEGGIFLAPDGQNGTLGLRAMVAMYDFGFTCLGLRRITAHIFSNNSRAVRINQAIGFVLMPDQESEANQLWELIPSAFNNRTSAIRHFFGFSETPTS